MNTAITDIFCRCVSYKIRNKEAVVLLRLHNAKEPIPIGSLAKGCGISTAGMTGLADSMEKKRLIRRASIRGEDRRKIFLFLAKKGKSIVNEMLSLNTEHTDQP